MRNLTTVAILAAVCLISSNAMATPYRFEPSDSDLGDLDHYKYYTWGINTPWNLEENADGSHERAKSATLSFDNIRNWDNNANDLYVHLLPGAPAGVTSRYDGQGGGDAFAGQGVLLAHYEDLPNTPQDITYTFSASDVSALNAYMQDGNFGLGFDPDCHYYNDGVMLTLEYVPEPATMGLLGLGGLGLLRRKRN